MEPSRARRPYERGSTEARIVQELEQAMGSYRRAMAEVEKIRNPTLAKALSTAWTATLTAHTMAFDLEEARKAAEE